MAGERLILKVALALSIIVMLLIMFGCAGRPDMSRREAVDIINLEKEIRK